MNTGRFGLGIVIILLDLYLLSFEIIGVVVTIVGVTLAL